MPWGGEDIGLQYCPVCSAYIVGVEETPDVPPCPHVLFVYFDDVGDFDPIRDDLRAAAEGIEWDFDSDTHPAEILSQRIDRDSAVCLHFGANSTGAGYAVCIDFAE